MSESGAERRLLSSGYRWVVLRPGEYAHMLYVEHHWKQSVAGVSLFDWDAPMAVTTECGVSTAGGQFHVTYMTAYETECCPDCWKLWR